MERRFTDMPSDPSIAGWARISNVKPADPPNLGSNQDLQEICKKYLKAMSISAEYACWVGLKLSPAVRRFSCVGFRGKRRVRALYARRKGVCRYVSPARARRIRPFTVSGIASTQQTRIRSHNLGMSGFIFSLLKALTERPVSQVVIGRVHTRCSN